ncbi:NADP-dependent malic enzyme [Candidatus Hydrogenedentota bacterium]
MDYAKLAMELHREVKGKIRIENTVSVESKQDLSIAYTPGVAEPCLEIERNPSSIYELTAKHNLVAIVTDGSAVLGLGNIGPAAGLPVMEGKAVLFKAFGDVDAFPICVDSQDPDEIIETCVRIAPVFGGINLEDIAAPKCFYIEDKLKKRLDIPIFHDDQHGTAVVCLAAMVNALKMIDKQMSDLTIAISGAGAAGIAVAKLLHACGAPEILIVDRTGIIHQGRESGMNQYKEEAAALMNPNKRSGDLADAIQGADVFIGVSAPGIVTQDMVRSMKPNPLLFPMANPVPEIMPDEAKAAGAHIIGTGRSDFPNQINNVLAFPGIFRGALDVRASDINDEMKLAAAHALADIIPEDKLSPERIIPEPFHPDIKERVSQAVAEAARNSGVARL